jgi:excisionase family DNA binding protein
MYPNNTNGENLGTPVVNYVLTDAQLERVITKIMTQYIEKHESENEEKYLSVTKTCSILGVSKSTLWRWEQENYLVPTRIGSKVRYRETEIKQLMKER